MKNAIILCLLLFPLAITSPAQDLPTHEIQIGYGPLARERAFGDIFGNFFRTLFGEELREMSFSRSFQVTYRYQRRQRVALGLVSGISTGSAHDDPLIGSKRDYKYTRFLLAFESKFNYSQHPNVNLYLLLGAGGVLSKDWEEPKGSTQYAKHYGYPTFQFTPFGIRVGKKIGVTAEIGYGYKGIVNIGLSGKF